MLYLLHEAPPEEQNFSMVMEMISAAEVHEDDDNYQSPLDILFERLEMREPDSIACKQYRIFKQAAGKTAKSILVSVGVRLAAFNLPSIAKLTMTDELHLQELGERKIALFCCIPDSDKSLNYLVGMIYTQLIQTLYRQADRIRKYNGLVTGLTQNVDELLRSDTARLMLANSEFLVMLNQSATDRVELAKLLNISDNQLGYVTNVPAGCGLIRCAGNIVPFTNSFPRNTKLYKLMSTNPSEKKE